MTLVVTWAMNEEVRCAADTRLSAGEATLSETGAKILIVPVVYNSSDDVTALNASRYTLGFSFCGSSLLAQNTHAIASTCSQILHSPDKGAVPRARTIATIFAKVGEYVTKDINSRVTDNQMWFQGLLFGYCPVERCFKQFILSPKLESNVFSMEIVEHTSKPGDLLAIGSGANEFLKQCQKKNALGKDRPPLEMFLSIVESGHVSTVGGHAQIAIASKHGVEIMPILAPEVDNPDAISVHVNGFNVKEIHGLDGFSYALRAIGVGTERVAGRRALRDKGIDPDRSDISRGLQNLASFEAALKASMRENVPLALEDIYTVEAPRPALGNWYCVGMCHCGQNTPICADPSEGKSPAQFVGEGYISVQCWKCREPVKAMPNTIKTLRWALPT